MQTEVDNDTLILQSEVRVDNSIERKDHKTFIPQSKADFNNFGHTIEIRIPSSDAYYIPSQSYVEVKGRLVRNDNDNVYEANAQIALINNAIMYMFSSIQYRLGGQII